MFVISQFPTYPFLHFYLYSIYLHVLHFILSQDDINLVPMKRNWDLERDLAKRMAQLDKLTHEAMLDLLRQNAAASVSSSNPQTTHSDE